jgi:hypothetical protein
VLGIDLPPQIRDHRSPLRLFPPTARPIHVDPGRPWNDLIGPFPNLPDVFKTSKFTHRTLPGGDIEQVRHDEDGHKVITVFSAKCDMAVASVISYLSFVAPVRSGVQRGELEIFVGGETVSRLVLPVSVVVGTE